jgi:hypothetical protein
VPEEKNRFLVGSRWAEPKFEYVAEFVLLVALDARSLLSRHGFG